jgi:hypothetical protein
MATLRGLIDGREIDCNATQDVFKHLEKAHRAKLKSDLTNVKLQTKLAPTRKLLELVDQMHPAPGDNQNQQVDNNGNPVNLQNPQLNQQGQPIPNQAPPMKPGMGQPNVQNKSTQLPQKKPAFGNANKTSTKDKLDQDKNKKQVGGKKGIEVHVKAKGERINQLNVKKKTKRYDFHDDAGISQMPSRGIGLSGGGPGSGRKPSFQEDSDNKDKLNSLHDDLTKQGFKFKYSSGSKTEHGMISHVYHKGNLNDKRANSEGRMSKILYERKNGSHSIGTM